MPVVKIEEEDMLKEEEEEVASNVDEEDEVLLVSLEVRLDVLLLVTELEGEGKEVVAGTDTDEDGDLVEMLAAEVKDDLVETKLRVEEEEEELAGTPTMTYPGVVPDGGTVDVNPVAPADICVILVAYL